MMSDRLMSSDIGQESRSERVVKPWTETTCDLCKTPLVAASPHPVVYKAGEAALCNKCLDWRRGFLAGRKAVQEEALQHLAAQPAGTPRILVDCLPDLGTDAAWGIAVALEERLQDLTEQGYEIISCMSRGGSFYICSKR